MIKIYKVKNYDEMSKKAATLIAAQVISNPESVLGLATGSTPVGTYKYLSNWYKEGYLDIDFSDVKVVNLDEYKGLPRNNDQSYYYFMQENLFKNINIRKENTHIPIGLEADEEKACSEYEAVIKSLGGVDLQVLGIGGNGHIGFNEPGEVFIKDCHCIELAPSTIKANSRFFESADEVPKKAYTMGIGNIMEAKEILLLASGKAKANAIKQLLSGEVTAKVPASVLQLHHHVTIIADEEALSETNI